MSLIAPTTKTRFIAYLVGIFLAGLVSGALLHSWWTPPPKSRWREPEQMAKDTEERFRKELKLSEDQIAKLHPMFLRNAQVIHGFDVETMQKIDAYLDRVREELIAQLTPEQAARFKEWETRRKEYFEKKSKPGHRGDKDGHK